MIKQLLPNKIITIEGMLFVLNLFLLRDSLVYILQDWWNFCAKMFEWGIDLFTRLSEETIS